MNHIISQPSAVLAWRQHQCRSLLAKLQVLVSVGVFHATGSSYKCFCLYINVTLLFSDVPYHAHFQVHAWISRGFIFTHKLKIQNIRSGYSPHSLVFTHVSNTLYGLDEGRHLGRRLQTSPYWWLLGLIPHVIGHISNINRRVERNIQAGREQKKLSKEKFSRCFCRTLTINS